MKFDVIYEYVKNYFKDNFLEAYLIFDGRIEYIEKKYILLFEKEIKNRYDINDIKNNQNLDKVNIEVREILNKFVREHFTEVQIDDCEILYNYVKNLLVKRGVNKNFSDDIFEHIVRLVMSRVWSQFDKGRLSKEDFDHVINLVYNNTCNQYAKMIDRKIEQILDCRLDFFEMQKMGVDKIELKKYVISSIFSKENKDFLTKIRNLVVTSGEFLSRSGIELNKYINQYFSNYSDKYSVNSDKVIEKSKVNDNQGISNLENVQNNSDVRFNREMMKNNSVQREGVPKKRKNNKQQVRIAKSVVLLALLGALVGVGVAYDDYNKEQNDMYAVMRTEGLYSSFDYSRTWARNEKYYSDMVNEIITLYSKLGQLPDENHKVLGLYEAYNGFVNVIGENNALSGMESFFSLLKRELIQNDIKEGLRGTVKADIEDNYFYLDFVYDTLIRAGFNELNDKKYQDVLLKYKYANFGNYYGVTGVFLTSDEKKLVNDIMSEYVQYYKQVKVDIGYLMIDGNYTFFPTYIGTSGRGM